MALIRKFASVETITMIALNLALLAAHPCQAQGTSFVGNTDAPESNGHSSGAALYSAPQEATAMAGAPAPSDQTAPADDPWHITFFPYLWFPGMHGTTGVLGFNTSVKASPGDLLSHFDIGLMGNVTARKQRFVAPVDFMWVALSDDKGLPENVVGIESISFHVGQFILTPKAGYQIIDTPKLKVDGLAGLRYWHLGEELHFNPKLFNGVSRSQNWVDGVAGARIEMVLSSKVSITVLGDAGGGGAVPDYQIAGLLGLKVKKKITLQAGWRSLCQEKNTVLRATTPPHARGLMLKGTTH